MGIEGTSKVPEFIFLFYSRVDLNLMQVGSGFGTGETHTRAQQNSTREGHIVMQILARALPIALGNDVV